jgi:hypothetical protein
MRRLLLCGATAAATVTFPSVSSLPRVIVPTTTTSRWIFNDIIIMLKQVIDHLTAAKQLGNGEQEDNINDMENHVVIGHLKSTIANMHSLGIMMKDQQH